jgi:hypothetical protein
LEPEHHLHNVHVTYRFAAMHTVEAALAQAILQL